MTTEEWEEYLLQGLKDSIKVISPFVKLEDITLKSKLAKDFSMDSLDAIELEMEIEELFELEDIINFDNDLNLQFSINTTVEDILNRMKEVIK